MHPSPLRLLAPCILSLSLFACSGKEDSDTGKKRPPKDSGDDTAQIVDADDDGYEDVAAGGDDCDDADPAVHPGATDPCDDLDNDCDGDTDEDADSRFADEDGDGYGDPAGPLACDTPEGVTNSADCDDSNPLGFPGADEACNGLDDNCNGTPDDGLALQASWLDADGDGAGDPASPIEDCEVPGGYTDNDWDCDDHDTGSPVWVETTGRYGARGTRNEPVSTLQEAIDRAPSCVRVGPGAYYESVNFNGVPTEVASTDGAAETWIYANGGPVVTFCYGEGAGSVLDGFSISGSTGMAYTSSYTYVSGDYTYNYHYSYAYGGGMYISGSSPTLRNIEITASTLPLYSYSYTNSGYTYDIYESYGFGGGIYVTSGSPTLTDVTISGSQAEYGGGIYVDSYSTLTGTRLALLGNTGGYGAALGSSYDNTIDLTNLIVNASVSEYSIGAIYAGYLTTLSIDHGTIVSNDYGVYGDYYVKVDISNSIIAGNTYGIYNASTDSTSTFTLTYNNVYTNTRGNYYGVDDPTGTNGNIQVGPRFTTYVDDADYTNDTLTLQSSSSCVDAGDPSETDLDGSGSDLGAFGGLEGGW